MEYDIEALTKLIELNQAENRIGEDGKPYIILRADQKVEDAERFMRHPSRKVGKPQFVRSASFCEYVNQQKTVDSRLYIPSQTQFSCVLDHHAEDSTGAIVTPRADWGQHRAQLDLKLTPEWQVWSARDKGSFGQREFAQFIEDNSDDVATPAGAELLDLVRTLKATCNAQYNVTVEDKPGTFSASYVQATRAQAGVKGDLDLPTEFTLSIAPYEGGNKILIVARLRFEINNEKLRLHYELVKIQKFLDRALADISAGIEKATGLTAWYGTPTP